MSHSLYEQLADQVSMARETLEEQICSVFGTDNKNRFIDSCKRVAHSYKIAKNCVLYEDIIYGDKKTENSELAALKIEKDKPNAKRLSEIKENTDGILEYALELEYQNIQGSLRAVNRMGKKNPDKIMGLKYCATITGFYDVLIHDQRNDLLKVLRNYCEDNYNLDPFRFTG